MPQTTIDFKLASLGRALLVTYEDNHMILDLQALRTRPYTIESGAWRGQVNYVGSWPNTKPAVRDWTAHVTINPIGEAPSIYVWSAQGFTSEEEATRAAVDAARRLGRSLLILDAYPSVHVDDRWPAVARPQEEPSTEGVPF